MGPCDRSMQKLSSKRLRTHQSHQASVEEPVVPKDLDLKQVILNPADEKYKEDTIMPFRRTHILV